MLPEGPSRNREIAPIGRVGGDVATARDCSQCARGGRGDEHHELQTGESGTWKRPKSEHSDQSRDRAIIEIRDAQTAIIIIRDAQNSNNNNPRRREKQSLLFATVARSNLCLSRRRLRREKQSLLFATGAPSREAIFAFRDRANPRFRDRREKQSLLSATSPPPSQKAKIAFRDGGMLKKLFGVWLVVWGLTR